MYRHWTFLERIPAIVAGGIYPTESNVSALHENAGPPVVWLLPPNVDPGEGMTSGLTPEKKTGWVDVDVPAIRWLDWQWTAMMTPVWKEAFINAAGGMEVVENFYVFPARIKPDKIKTVGTREVRV